MKKVFTTLLLSLLVFGTLFAAPKKSLSLEPIEMETLIQQGEEFTYVIDPRIEVVAMICRLAGFETFTQNYNGDNAFLSQMDTLFEKQKEHKVVKEFQKYRSQKNIYGDAWLNLALHIKPDFSGTIVDLNPYPADLNPDLKKLSPKQLNTIVTLIHDFVVDTKFQRIALLNKASYLSDLGWMKEDVEKLLINTWGKEFYKDPEVNNIQITTSRICLGDNYYDYFTGSDGKRHYNLTFYPGNYVYHIMATYSNLYTQAYADRIWDKVKDNYVKYLKDYSKKLYPDQAKEIDKEEIYSNSLAMLISSYAYIDFCKFKAERQTPEDIQKYGDWAQAYESSIQYFQKSYGKDADAAIALLQEYEENRDKYPDFKSLEPKFIDYLNSLKIE